MPLGTTGNRGATALTRDACRFFRTSACLMANICLLRTKRWCAAGVEFGDANSADGGVFFTLGVSPVLVLLDAFPEPPPSHPSIPPPPSFSFSLAFSFSFAAASSFSFFLL